MNAVTPASVDYGWCDHCAGEGKLYTSRYGGNDPDVWATGRCPVCDGSSMASPDVVKVRGIKAMAQALIAEAMNAGLSDTVAQRELVAFSESVTDALKDCIDEGALHQLTHVDERRVAA